MSETIAFGRPRPNSVQLAALPPAVSPNAEVATLPAPEFVLPLSLVVLSADQIAAAAALAARISLIRSAVVLPDVMSKIRRLFVASHVTISLPAPRPVLIRTMAVSLKVAPAALVVKTRSLLAPGNVMVAVEITFGAPLSVVTLPTSVPIALVPKLTLPLSLAVASAVKSFPIAAYAGF